MRGTLHQLRASLRLHFRNRMGLIYGYLFPALFLAAFRVLYRHEPVPLAGHMGELLTVSILGGACFGLPTTLVSERERGVWRRYRLAPVSSGALVASTVAARYLILVTAALLLLALAMAVGMPLPEHPLQLWVAFTFASFAFLGLGLVIAMLADNVPAVQALGQCIFLPMLIIGGVAVRLSSLPDWAQHLSAFFPGRYAVEAMQQCITGDGLSLAGFSLLALLLIGAAGCLAGARLFRWDARQRFTASGGKRWLLVALAAWVAVGLLAEARGRAKLTAAEPTVAPTTAPSAAAPARPAPAVPLPSDSAPVPPAPAPAAPDTSAAAPGVPSPAPETTSRPAEPRAAATGAAAPAPVDTGPPSSWRAVDPAHIDPILFRDLPPDEDVVAPIGSPGERIYRDEQVQIECIGKALRTWAPAQVADPVQRARNFLYVAAVPDVLQLTIERWVPGVVFTHMRADFVQGDLVRILYWIATHPDEGSLPSLTDLRGACLQVGGTVDSEEVRHRIGIYALKLLGRLTGRIAGG